IGATDGIRLVTDVVRGRSAPSLLKAAEDADLLVVGTRGQTGFQAFTLGSTAARVAAHAPCPVAVVPATGPLDPPQRIVVALDGSHHSVAALDHAVDLARAGAHLDVITVDDGDAGFGEPHDRLTLAEAQRALVDAAVERRDPDRDHEIEIETRVATGSARQVLLDATADADLLVVGRRGRGFAGSLRLGSVSHWLLAHSPVTVVAVPWTFDPGSSATDERRWKT
ncbi:MAG: universal stress protein, partial [Actinomycetota bacterium]